MEKFLRFVLLLFVCGKSLSLSGSDGKIIVWLQDGNNVVLRINEMPEFQYTDGSIIVYNGKTIHKWPLEKVQKFTFENIVSDIGHVHTDKGDVNGDGIVNGTDIQAVINFIVAGEFDAKADVNQDGKVNGTDIQEIINIIVSQD